jgi:hypothetical protein
VDAYLNSYTKSGEPARSPCNCRGHIPTVIIGALPHGDNVEYHPMAACLRAQVRIVRCSSNGFFVAGYPALGANGTRDRRVDRGLGRRCTPPRPGRRTPRPTDAAARHLVPTIAERRGWDSAGDARSRPAGRLELPVPRAQRAGGVGEQRERSGWTGRPIPDLGGEPRLTWRRSFWYSRPAPGESESGHIDLPVWCCEIPMSYYPTWDAWHTGFLVRARTPIHKAIPQRTPVLWGRVWDTNLELGLRTASLRAVGPWVASVLKTSPETF